MFDYMRSIRDATHNQIDTLGEEITLQCGSTVKAIFDYPTQFSSKGSVELNLHMPSIFIKDTDFYPSLKKLEARGEVFVIDRSLPDGAGAVELKIVEKREGNAPKHVFGGFE